MTGPQGLQGISNSQGTPLPVSPLPSTGSCLHIFTQTPLCWPKPCPPPPPNFKMQLRTLRGLPGIDRLESSFHNVLRHRPSSEPVSDLRKYPMPLGIFSPVGRSPARCDGQGLANSTDTKACGREDGRPLPW